MAPTSVPSTSKKFQKKAVNCNYNYDREADRLLSFSSSNFNLKHDHVTAKDLAALGFYIEATGSVKCRFCKVPFENFQNGETALQNHQKWSPNCPLLLRRKTDNIPLNAAELDKILPEKSSDVCGSGIMEETSADEHPHFRSPRKRLESFESWPKAMKQTPRELVEAGFFYSGQSDIAVCFSCGLALGKWEETDNPWVEHHQNAQTECSYLKKNERVLNENLKKIEEKKTPQKLSVERDDSLDQPIDNSTCKICLQRKSSIVFLPCKHVAVCDHCSLLIEDICPICRGEIKEKISLFFA